MKLGVSVYSGLTGYSLEKNIEYLKKAKSFGYTKVFSSLHIAEAGDIKSEFEKIADTCDSLGLELNVDISKPAFEALKPIKNIKTLRLDWGFSKEDIINLSHEKDYTIELNASVVNYDYIKDLVDSGIDPSHTSFSFNFYPKKYTGHDADFIFEQTKMLHSFGFSVYAFVPSHVESRAPLFEGLPTIESHRYCKLGTAIEELKACKLDGIYFGDAYASDEELKTLIKHADDNLVTLDIKDNEYDFLFKNTFNIRRDINSYILRFNHRDKLEVKPIDTSIRHIGDITIDNEGFKRYMGEFNIVICELEKDDRANVIAHAELTPLIINNLKKTLKVRFEKER